MVAYTRFPPKDMLSLPASSGRRDTSPPKNSAKTAIRKGNDQQPAATSISLTIPTSQPETISAKLNKAVPLLMFSLILPIILNFGSLRLSPNRLILVILIVPLILKWLKGAAGRIRTADILIILTTVWMAITFIIYGGVGLIQYSGITGIEMLGPYLMARCYIRTEAQYLTLLRTLRWIVIILAPIAIIEATTRMRLLNMAVSPFFPTFGTLYDPRWGMQRAQTGFEHPILYGSFVAFTFSPVYFALRQKAGFLKSVILAAPIGVATFFALSVGAYIGILIQFLLIGWGFVFKQVPNRWHILTALAIFAYIFIDIFSNRTPFEVFITYLTFNSHSSYWRVLIFTYGIENVWANPLFGLGLGDWTRPSWMYGASVDNFWLLMAMRHGIMGFVFVFAFYMTILGGLIRAKPIAESVQIHRKALVFSFIGLAIAICTVHLWSASFVFMMFMLGAGSWMSDVPQTTDEDQPNIAPDDDQAPQSQAKLHIRS